MTYGSEPRRRRWPSDASRWSGKALWPGESRQVSEDDDAEDWLAGLRPDSTHADRDTFGDVPAAFGRSVERPGRRRRAEPGDDDWSAPPAAVDPTRPAGPETRPAGPETRSAGPETRPAWPETWQEWSGGPVAKPGRHSAFPPGREGPATGDARPAGSDERPVRDDGRPIQGRRRAPEPDDLPTGLLAPPPAAPTRTTATASVPVAGTSRPPMSPAAQPPTPPTLRRTTASARVAPPETARVPAAGEARRRALEDSGTVRRPREDSGTIRRPHEDSGPIRRSLHDSGRVRRPLHDSGPVRRPLHDSGAIRRSPQEPTERPNRRTTGAGAGRSLPTWLSRVLVVVTVVILALVGLGGYMLINGRRSNTPVKQPATGTEFKGRDISSRDADPVAMTEPEVFPGKQVTVRSTTYPVLKTQAGECATAATDDLAKLLTDLGCSQVVRGTLKSADAQFLITAGIFNLTDEASANKAYETIKPTLDAQKGRFTGLAAGDGTEAIVRAPTTLGWHPVGHFLAYCIVARADGKPIAADDTGSKQVISDVVEGYLRDNVLAARAAGPVSAPK